MDDSDDVEYYSRREKAARKLAEQANSDMIAAIHYELARLYAAKSSQSHNYCEAGGAMRGTTARQA